MKLLVVAVGQRQPGWADTAWADFAKRFPPEMRLELKALKAEPRSGGKTAAQCMAAEAGRLEAAVPKGARRVVLDEHGTRLDTAHVVGRQFTAALGLELLDVFCRVGEQRPVHHAQLLQQLGPARALRGKVDVGVRRHARIVYAACCPRSGAVHSRW